MDKMTRRSLLRALIGAFFARACICERFRLRSAGDKIQNKRKNQPNRPYGKYYYYILQQIRTRTEIFETLSRFDVGQSFKELKWTLDRTVLYDFSDYMCF